MLTHLKKLRVRDKNADNTVLFFHVPKTGGTTFCKLLERMFDGGFKRLIGAELKNAMGNYPRSLGYRAFAGHFSLANLGYVNWIVPITHLTLLREPVDRVLSQYYFLRANKEHDAHSIAIKYSIKEIYELGLGERMGMQNLQVNLFSSLPKIDYNSRRELMYAKENLVNLFTSFGVTEKYEEFIQMCNQDFGWALQDIPRLNPTIRPAIQDEPPEIINLIRAHNQLDAEFYDYALTCYEKNKVDYVFVSIAPVVEKEFREVVSAAPLTWARIKAWFKKIFGGGQG